MIQNISPHSFNNQYQSNKEINPQDFIFYFKDNLLLLKQTDSFIKIPQKKDITPITDKTEKTFLFTLDETACFLIKDNLKIEDPNLVYYKMDFFRMTEQPEIAWAGILAFQLMNWYSQNKFCGKCGKKMQHRSDERALLCPHCNLTIYPKLSPAVIAVIKSNDKILLARNAMFKNKWFALIAGYVDIGESLEETLVREAKEEVGLDIKNIRYYMSQPWPFSGSMMVGFIADADENQPIKVDNKEIVEAAWFTRDNLPPHPSDLSISGEMIKRFKRGEI